MKTPPGFLRSEPPQLTRNFSESKVRIYFDEFVQFNNVNQQVIISPPMKEKPTFKLKGRSVVIEFNEELPSGPQAQISVGPPFRGLEALGQQQPSGVPPQ